MKFSRLGIIAAMAMAFCGQQALAADAPPAFKIDPKVHEQSMKDAPALVQAAGLNDCMVGDAYLLGTGEEKVDGKSVKSNFYEVACTGSMGYLLKSATGGPTTIAADCLALKNANDKALAAKQKPGTICQLPENKDPATGLTGYLTKASAPCASITGANWMGASPSDKITVYEVACTNGGYIITAPQPGSTKTLNVIPCAKSSTVGVSCTLTTADQVTKQIAALAASSGKANCTPTKARWVVTDPSNGNDYYEIGCSDDKTGYMFQTDKSGAFKQTIECVRATRIAGGCTYMDVNTGSTADVATYQKLAQQIQYPCKVSKYQGYGAENGGQREIVELACSDHAAGAYAMMPTGAGQTGEYFNCVRAVGRGLTCHLSPMAATYELISKQIAERGKVTCAVDGGRDIGKDDKGQDYVEVTCGSQPELVLTYSRLPQETLISAVPCAQAPIANACTLKK